MQRRGMRELRRPKRHSSAHSTPSRIDNNPVPDLNRRNNTLHKSFLSLTRKVLKRLVLRLSEQERRPNTRRHEQRKDLQNMLHERVRTFSATMIPQLRKTDLRDDRAELAAGGRDTVCGRAITRRERFTRDDERSRVRAKVLEEVGQAVKHDEPILRRSRRVESVVTETHSGEKNSENSEAHELDGLAAPGVDEEEGEVVARNEACSGENDVADADVAEVVVDLLCAGDGLWGCAKTVCTRLRLRSWDR